jgi:hypothetical protein
MLFVIKGYLPMKTIESSYLYLMACRLRPRVVFLIKELFVDDVFFGLVEKTMFTCVHLAFANCISSTCTFDLWMSKGAHDVFVVDNFLSYKWEAKHITIRFFEMSNSSGATMAPRL